MDMLRTSCVIGAIVFALPMPTTGTQSGFQFMSKATAQFSDLATFCSAHARICSVTDSVVTTVQAKVQYSANLIVAWAEEATSRGGDVVAGLEAYADQIQTGSTTMFDEAALRGSLYPDS
jgi:hypothetical protein